MNFIKSFRVIIIKKIIKELKSWVVPVLIGAGLILFTRLIIWIIY